MLIINGIICEVNQQKLEILENNFNFTKMNKYPRCYLDKSHLYKTNYFDKNKRGTLLDNNVSDICTSHFNIYYIKNIPK